MRIQTQIEALPTIRTLRLCHRFGHGRFKYIPVELVKTIEGYVVQPMRKEVAKDLERASRCFKKTCSVVDHEDRDVLIQVCDDWRRDLNIFIGIPHDSDGIDVPSNPSDAELLKDLKDIAAINDTPELHDVDETVNHEAKRSEWPDAINKIFSEKNRSMFRDRFGLDIWHSFARLHGSQGADCHIEGGEPQATITYLTLPDQATRRRKWRDHVVEDEETGESRTDEANHAEHGFGVAVDLDKQPSTEELARFPQALKVLGLKEFVHSSQKQYPALKLGSSDETAEPNSRDGSGSSDGPQKSRGAGTMNGKDATAMPFPHPTLLTRYKG